MRRFLILLALIFALAVPAAAQGEDCPGAPAPRLTYGIEARVLPGAPNRLRAEPNTSAEIVGEIGPGETAFVGSGPVCAESYLWWYVNYNGIVGWTVEGSGDEYFLEPLPENVVSTIGDAETSVEFEGITYTFANGLGTAAPLGVSAIVVPQEEPVEEGPYWIGHPDYLEFKFDSYSLENDQRNAYLRIFPVQAFAEMNEYVADQVSALQRLLASTEGIPTAEPLPFLPVFNAGQVFRAQVERLDFENGSGIRFLTRFAQDVYPVSNQDLLYTFQGITDDGQYYVSAILPITADMLPNEIEPDFDFEAFVTNYEQYMTDLVDTLNSAASDAYMPELNTLDAMIESLQIEPALG